MEPSTLVQSDNRTKTLKLVNKSVSHFSKEREFLRSEGLPCDPSEGLTSDA